MSKKKSDSHKRAESARENPYAVMVLDKAEVALMPTDKLMNTIDRKVKTLQNLAKDADPEVKKAAKEALARYTNEQMALFASKKLNPERALHESITPCQREDGRVEFRIVKRAESAFLGELDFGDNGQVTGVSVCSASARMGMAREERRGKYNDGAMLINNEAANIDRSEYVSWSSLD